MKSIYINAASSISKQDTFSKSGFSKQLLQGTLQNDELVEPIYKEYIPPALLRRTPKINKMALACTRDCLDQFPVEELDAIVTGTGLGCLMDTQKFLDVMIQTAEGSMMPPTAFIQSGHNAVAGQIALLHKNRNYNMTHVQKGLSFEYALLDAILCVREERENVLVGAGDEMIDLLSELASRLSLHPVVIEELSEGSSFFILSGTGSEVKIVDVRIASSNWKNELNAMLEASDLQNSDIDMAFTGFNLEPSISLDLPFDHFEYTKSCGRYFSSSAFGFHLAQDYLKTKGNGNALIINFADNDQVGLTLLTCD